MTLINYYEEEMKSVKEKKKLIYRSPLPTKSQRVVHHRGRSSKAKTYAEEEILIYQMKLAAEALGR